MNILITGGTGFLGSHLTERLIEDPSVESITILTRSVKQNTSFNILKLHPHRKINLVRGDVRDFDILRLLFSEYSFDGIFHFGALSEVGKCQKDVKLAFDVNIGGTVNVLECARLYGNIKFIIIGSSERVYGEGKLPYSEESPLNGTATYEVSKSAADLIGRTYFNNYDLPVVITRCTNLYGGGDMTFSRVIPNNIKKILNNENPLIWTGSENSTREFLYIEDAVDAYLSLVDNIDTTKGNVYNIGSGEKITIEELLKLILNEMQSNLSIEYKDNNFPETSHHYLNSNKIKRDTDWKCKFNLKSGIKKTVDFYKEYYDKS